uniref:STAS domain-containing protein n=1 Tax=Steinernema glaseri TaxID=37863 RepID=A0A1I8A1B6_9BILA
MLSICALLICSLPILVAAFYLHTRKYPPGPLPFPLIGNAPQVVIGHLLGKTVPELLVEWKKKYGNVVTIWLGPSPTVCVLDYELALQTYVKNGDAYVGRQHIPLVDEMRGRLFK